MVMIWCIISMVHYLICFLMGSEIIGSLRIMVPVALGKGTGSASQVLDSLFVLVIFFVLSLLTRKAVDAVNNIGEWWLSIIMTGVAVIVSVSGTIVVFGSGGWIIYCIVRYAMTSGDAYINHAFAAFVVMIFGFALWLLSWDIVGEDKVIPLTPEELMIADWYEQRLLENEEPDDNYVSPDPHEEWEKHKGDLNWIEHEKERAKIAREKQVREYARLGKELLEKEKNEPNYAAVDSFYWSSPEEADAFWHSYLKDDDDDDDDDFWRSLSDGDDDFWRPTRKNDDD